METGQEALDFLFNEKNGMPKVHSRSENAEVDGIEALPKLQSGLPTEALPAHRSFSVGGTKVGKNRIAK